MGSDPREISVKYLAAVGQKRFEEVAQYLHPELRFEMPGKTIEGAKGYISALQRLGPILLRNEIEKVFVDGEDVCLIYQFVTDTKVGAVPSMEWLKIEGGLIKTVRLLFHSQPWPAVLDELARRTAQVA